MSVPLKTRILLADDHLLVRHGLRMVLNAAPDPEVSAEAGDGAEAVELALREQELHLAVLDVAMPRMTGLQAAAELSRRRPELKLLMLSMHESEQYLFEALKAGASGYVLKTAADRDPVEAVRAAMRGEPFLYPAAVTALIRDYLARTETPADPLSPRELQVLKLIAEAYTSDQIAQALSISRRTVDRHRENILAKLGMRDRVELHQGRPAQHKRLRRAPPTDHPRGVLAARLRPLARAQDDRPPTRPRTTSPPTTTTAPTPAA